MKFKDFLLQEIGTSTGDVAGFRRMSLPLVKRMWPPNIAAMVSENPPVAPGKKKKPFMQPQVKENAKLDKQGTDILKKAGLDKHGRPKAPDWISKPSVDARSNYDDIQSISSYNTRRRVNRRG